MYKSKIQITNSIKSKQPYRYGVALLFLVGALMFSAFFCLTNGNTSEVSSFLDAETKSIGVSGDNFEIEKQKGVHLFGVVDSMDYSFVHDCNIEWITLVPWGFQEGHNSAEVMHYRGDSLQIISYDSSWVAKIKRIQAEGFKVFVKPHIWIDAPEKGKWRSDIYPQNDQEWEAWKTGYREFILRYARIAESAGAEMYCIGTEMTRLSIEKPKFWKTLIKEVRSVYSGKLTYAANWYREYEKLEFWDELDYIGIQAYFPLTDIANPSIDQISQGWHQHLKSITKVQKKYGRQVIFTELGYKSTTSSAAKPWLWTEDSPDSDNLYSLETQSHCYQSFFDVVWPQKWFSGVHIWQMRNDFDPEDRWYMTDFTPQGKPALDIITMGFE